MPQHTKRSLTDLMDLTEADLSDAPDVGRAWIRPVAAALVSLMAALAIPRRLGLVAQSLTAFDAGVIVLLVFDALVVLRSTSSRLRRLAFSRDRAHTVIWLVISAGSAIGLLFAASVMRHAHALAPAEHDWVCAASVVAVFSAWLLTNLSFALRYAQLYFRRQGSREGGLRFPGGQTPDGLDFAYFAFTLGMCFQVSDVVIASRPIRHLALAQSILCFVYNTVILGMTLNLFFGMLS